MALPIAGMSKLRVWKQGRSWCQIASYLYNQGQGWRTVHSETKTYSESQTLDMDKVMERSIGETITLQKEKMKLKPDQPANPKFLEVAIIGTYNSGKSTLTNSLMGWKVSPSSSKIHTTQRNVLAVLTEGDTQVVLRDSPGIIRRNRVPSKHRIQLKKSIKEDPRKSLSDADMICVLVDAADSWDSEWLDEGVYKLLENHKNIPAFLVLNKTDLVEKKDYLLHITRTLTSGCVGGKSIPIRTKKKLYIGRGLDPLIHAQNKTKERQLRDLKEAMFDRVDKIRIAREKKKGKISHAEQAEKDKVTETSVDNQVTETQADNQVTEAQADNQATETQNVGTYSQSTETSQVLHSYDNSLGTERPDIPPDALKKPLEKGWSHFERVFMVSALTGDGVSAIKDHLISKAVRKDWHYHSCVVTNQSPVELAEKIVWEKMLEHVDSEIPYKNYPEVVEWVLEEDLLRISMQISLYKQSHKKKIQSQIETIRRNGHQSLMDAFRMDIQLQIHLSNKGQRIHVARNVDLTLPPGTKLPTDSYEKWSSKQPLVSNNKDESFVERPTQES